MRNTVCKESNPIGHVCLTFSLPSKVICVLVFIITLWLWRSKRHRRHSKQFPLVHTRVTPAVAPQLVCVCSSMSACVHVLYSIKLQEDCAININSLSACSIKMCSIESSQLHSLPCTVSWVDLVVHEEKRRAIKNHFISHVDELCLSCWLTSRLMCCQLTASAAQIRRGFTITPTQWYSNIDHRGRVKW